MRRLVLLFMLLGGAAVSAQAQDFNQSYNFLSSGTNGPTSLVFTNSGITSWFLSWVPAGPVSACTIRVDSSRDNVSWGTGDVVAAQSCATAGAAKSGFFSNAYVRINVTTLTNGTLNVTLKGYGGSIATATIGSKLRTIAAAARASNPIVNPPLQAVAAWQATTAYTVGQVVANGGNDYICYTAGTSAGSGGPSGTGAAPITDNTVTWYFYRATATTTSSAIAPTLSTATSAVGGLTKGYSTGTNDSNFLYLGGVPSGSGNGGYCMVSWSFNTSGGNCTTTGSQSDAGVSFMTDAPKLDVRMNWGSGIIRFVVDGQYIQLSAQPSGGSNPFYYIIDFTAAGGRKVRKITVEFTNAMGFRGVDVDPQSQVWAPDKSDFIRAIFIGDSYTNGGNGFPIPPRMAWPGEMSRMLGWQDSWIDASGNVGYVQTNSGGSPTCAQSVPLSVSPNSPDIVVIMDGNDDLSFTVAQIQAGALACWQAVRAALPSVPIVVTGIFNAGGPTATTTTAETGIQTTFNQWADPNSYFIPISIDAQPWSTGTGRVNSTTGVGNGDVYISTDSVHPVQGGIDYLALKMANAMRTLVLPNIP